MAYGSKTQKDSTLYVNGVGISGIQSVSVSQQTPTDQINTSLGLGWGFVSAPVNRSFSINRVMIVVPDSGSNVLNMSSDTVGSPFSGAIDGPNDDQSISFSSGYVNSFSLSCGIGEMPTASSSVSVYGLYTRSGEDLGNTGNILEDIGFPTTETILVSGEEWLTDRIVNFSIQKSIKIEPIYGFSNNELDQVIEVKALNPVEVEASFEYEIDEGSMEESGQFVDFRSNVDDVTFSTPYKPSISIRDTNQRLIYEISGGSVDDGNGAVLVSEQFNYNVDEVLKATRTYKWHEWSVL
jgi:hypothetical protein